MKQFIVFLAIFPFMMAFMIQFTLQQNSDYQINMINQEICNAKEVAKVNGGFSSESIKSMKKNIAAIAKCNEDDINVEVSEDIKYRTNEFDEREMIFLRIAVPVKNLMAMPGLFGIDEDENQTLYVVENEFPSERLM